jgi:MFS family permease
MPGAANQPESGADARRWLMLVVLVTGQFMALLDVMIVNVAMPSIHQHLHASGAALQLVVAGYTIPYAMLLITGARLGDLRGERRLFLSGLVTFTLASLACGLAPTTGVLIGARIVQGIGAALMVPQILSVIQQQFSGAARARALSVWTAILASGAVVGQVLGGVLVSANLFDTAWRPVFLVNVPVGLLLTILVPRLIPRDQVLRDASRKLDLAGLATASGGVLLVVLPLVLGHEEGWPAWTWISLAAGIAVLGAFLWIERAVARRGGDPLLHLEVVRAPGMASGLATIAVVMTSFGGFLFSLTLHLQLALGDSPLRAGLTFAPAALAFGAAGYWWRRLPSAVHPLLTPIGLLVASAAYLSVARDLHSGTHGGALLPIALLFMGVGMGGAFGPLANHSLVKVPFRQAADASGLLTTTVQLSQVIGVAVFGSLYLSLAAHRVAHASASALSRVDTSLAAIVLLGIASGALLARTVLQARAAQAAAEAAPASPPRAA